MNGIIFRLGSIGDTVIALPTLTWITTKFPDVRWTLLTDARSAKSPIGVGQILSDWNFVDQVIALPTGKSPRSMWKALSSVRALQAQVALYLPPRERSQTSIWRDRAFLKVCGVRIIVGPTRRRLNLQRAERPLLAVASESEDLLESCANSVGLSLPADRLPRLIVPRSEVQAMRSWLLAKNADCGQKMLGMGIGSKAPSKLWPLDRYIEVAATCMRLYGAVPVVFGGVEDRASAERLLSAIGGGVNACGELSIRQSVALMTLMTAFVGNDSGPMHLAYAAGVFTVGVFAAQDVPGRWYPPPQFGQAIRRNIECEGCRLLVCPRDNECLALISPSDVLRALVPRMS